MSSNRRILESMLSSESNASRNDTHNNRSNPVRAKLARLIELRNAQQNDTLPFTLTAASSDNSIYEFASDAGRNLDVLKERGLLNNLGMQQVGSNLCNELGSELYSNSDCYPYVRYIFEDDNDDAKQHFSTLLAMYACSPNATALTDSQRGAIDDYCKYNDRSPINPWPIIASAFAAFLLGMGLIVFINRQRHNRDRAIAANYSATNAAIPQSDPLREGLLANNNTQLASDGTATESTARMTLR
jgi:hypothetical protein